MPSTFIIAEAGVNHNGSLDLALKLVDAAADAQADAVKFQTFKAEALVSTHAQKAEYQKRAIGDEDPGQLPMLKSLELSYDDFHALVAHAAKRGIALLSTPFDPESADFLIGDLKLPRIKISSGDLTNAPFLHSVARRGKPMILSSGMAMLADIEQALEVIAHGYVGKDDPTRAAFRRAYLSEEGQAALRKNVALLHCTTEYPAPPEDANLRVIGTLRDAFGLETGYSDHSTGIAVSLGAVALGARIIEKHFTLDRTMEGPDHSASLEPAELAEMVASIRVVERALGRTGKFPVASEEANRKIACKSLTANRDIAARELFTANNLTCKRPEDGMAPILYWDLLGTPATRAYKADEAIVP